MKKVYLLFTLIFLTCACIAQNRYYDAMFGVTKTPDVIYGKNITVITGAPAQSDLLVDIYIPEGDTKTDRPLILMAHTGSFLPFFLNGQITGSRNDSAMVHSALYMASRGFVVGVYTYRFGWNPVAPDQNVRTSTLLQAAYRGIQDTRTCIRFFKKTAAEGNMYGIDPGKICVWGVGTGGYLSMGAGSLNDFSEVVLDKFINTTTALPYIDSMVMGNIWGTTQAAICLPNHPNYSSEFQLSVNIGGALGDSTWIDGEDIEPAFTGVHCSYDLFAPYYEGPVIVPTTGDFVIFATGSRKAIESANTLGSNDILKSVDPAHDPLHNLIQDQKSRMVGIYPSNIPNVVIQGTDNFYGFNIPIIYNGAPVPQGSPWEWWDYNTLKAVVAFFNTQVPPSRQVNADTLHLNGLRTNPDMSAEKGKRYLDTVFALVTPRICAALDLGCTHVGLKEVNSSDIQLEISPTPAYKYISFKTGPDFPIKSIYLFDLKGNLVKAHVDINSSEFNMPRDQISSGYYLAQVRTKDKVVTKQIIYHN